MSESMTTKDINFILQPERISAGFLAQDPYQPIRRQSLAKFETWGLPTRKWEEWKYLSLEAMFQNKFQLPGSQNTRPLPELKDIRFSDDINLIFINGVFQKDLSSLADLPAGLCIRTLKEELKQNPKETLARLARYELGPNDMFVALNDSLWQDGAFIHVAKGAVIKRPIHILHISSAQYPPLFNSPRTLILLSENAQAEIIETHLPEGEGLYGCNAVSDIFIDANARLEYMKFQRDSLQAFHIGKTRVWLERDSHMESFSLACGGQITRNNLSVTLNGEGAHATINGLYAVTQQQVVDNHTEIFHIKPNTTSSQLYKGILHQNANGIFNGKIFVHKEAQKTNAYQLNKNLLLSRGCEINTKPQLEIFADDVKCTHGATIGQLHDDELFYLQSRCIPKAKAIQMLSRGFINDILITIPNRKTQAKAEKLLSHIFSVI